MFVSRAVSDPRRFAGLTLVAFALTTVGLFANPRTTFAWGVNSFSSASESKLVSLTNQARAAAGLRSLKVDSKLTSIARWRSKDMIQRNYFSHTILGTSYNVFHVLDQKGYCYHLAGENIGWNNYPDDVATTTIQRQFMESPGHRANILGKAWDVIGVGAYKGPTGKKMWTVIFADRCGSTSSGGGGGGGGGGGSDPAPKPTPKPQAASPKPAPTERVAPTPSPEPAASPSFAGPPDLSEDVGLGLGPGGQGNGSGGGGETGNGGASGDGTPPGHVRDADPAKGEGGNRIVDPSTPPGLFETVVGGVTGFFLGL